jgi:hypothetical protein
MKKTLFRITKLAILPALLTGLFATDIEAQVMTNRTPDKAQIQGEKKPTFPSTIKADPALFPAGTAQPSTPERQASLTYYVHMIGAKRVLVSDAQGRTDNLFKTGTTQQVQPAKYEFLGENTLYVIVPVGETYSITFESVNPAMTLEIVKGQGDVSPDEAVRYNDLVLEKGRARFQLSAEGVGPVRLDANHDGRFESILEPSAHVRGLAAKDTRGPELKFEVLERDATSALVSIKAVDRESGVKNVYYSTDNKHDFPYETPVRVNLSQSTFIVGVADDNAGNRSVAVYELAKRPLN